MSNIVVQKARINPGLWYIGRNKGFLYKIDLNDCNHHISAY